MDWNAVHTYLKDHPLALLVLAAAIGLASSGAVLLVGLWRARSFVEAERLKLRHEISLRWLNEFDDEARRFQRCLDDFDRGAASVREATDADALARAFVDGYLAFSGVCLRIMCALPGHWIRAPLEESADRFLTCCMLLSSRLHENRMVELRRQGRQLENAAPAIGSASLDAGELQPRLQDRDAASPEPSTSCSPGDRILASIHTAFHELCGLVYRAAEESVSGTNRWAARRDIRRGSRSAQRRVDALSTTAPPRPPAANGELQHARDEDR